MCNTGTELNHSPGDVISVGKAPDRIIRGSILELTKSVAHTLLTTGQDGIACLCDSQLYGTPAPCRCPTGNQNIVWWGRNNFPVTCSVEVGGGIKKVI